MKFALVDGQRQEPQPGLSGACIGCGNPMVAKCGEVRIWHWAHRSRHHCDSWWENETEWHRDWKEHYPVNWQEVVHHAEDGERHIADVKTGDDWVIEFQHSYIKPEERRSREAYYPKMVWVVDGLRRKRDESRFQRGLELADAPFGIESPVRMLWADEGALLRDWVGSRAHVFFDFGCDQPFWWIFPISGGRQIYAVSCPRSWFIDVHRRELAGEMDSFDVWADRYIEQIEKHESERQNRIRDSEFRQKLAREARDPLRIPLRRRRFRL